MLQARTNAWAIRAFQVAVEAIGLIAAFNFVFRPAGFLQSMCR